jgi:hypothetical protein
MKIAFAALAALGLATAGLAACTGIPDPETLVYANGEPCTERDEPGFGSLGPSDNACLTKKEWRIAKADRSEKRAYSENQRTNRQNLPQSYSPEPVANPSP